MTGKPPERQHVKGAPYINGNGHVKGDSNGVGHPNGVSNGARHVAQRTRSKYDRFVKPVIDRAAALLLIIILLPVLLAVAAAVWFELGSPVFIRQRRVGLGGRVFGMFKFRTMHPDRRRAQLHVPPHEDRRRTHKSANDPRHTKLGRFLRRTSLDELPQLFNVLAGHMSLVGPRPELADVVERLYQPWQLQRHIVKPGMTGLWQVTNRAEGDGDMHLHTEDDLEYIRQIGLRTDLWILLRTPMVILAPRRARQVERAATQQR